ncbi:MAG: sigma-70 family RNA polymerase sigma factor [Planctomycetaceae bacterium]|nr:sigma-70 family RNA polymerase sigma factor [Planctomycetaceae bacterium]
MNSRSDSSEAVLAIGETGLADVVSHEFDWETILKENLNWLRRLLFVRLGEAEAVDECLQEVGMAAVRQAAPIRDPAKIGSWLYQLAIRQALLYRRKMGRKRNLLKRYAARNSPTESDDGVYDPLTWLLDRERASAVRTALGELKPEDRDILLLKYAENWSYDQIAEHLGVSHSAVEARLHRSRQRLRKEIERQELPDEFE